MRRLRDMWVDHPRLDWLLALPGILLAASNLASTAPTERESAAFFAIMQAVSATSGVVLGMAGVVYGLFQQSKSGNIESIRARYRNELRRNWRAVFSGLIVACAGSLLSLGVYLTDARVAAVIGGWASVFMLVRALRMTWLLNLYVDVDRADSLPAVQVRQDIAER